MAKRQQEIHVPSKMNDACVKEERGDERESTAPRRLRWNQSETLNNLAQMWKSQETGANNGSGKQPCCPRSSLLFRCIELDRHSKEGGDLFPRFLGCGAVEVRALGLFGQSLDFSNREHLARFLRQFRSDRLRLARNKRFNFVSVEPDKMAVLADVHADFPLVG